MYGLVNKMGVATLRPTFGIMPQNISSPPVFYTMAEQGPKQWEKT